MDRLRPHDPERIGPYRLRGRLGAGGMGEVYVAESPGGREVVVKIIRPELADTVSARRRFAREIDAARRVGGFHTAQVVDADPDADPPWMATEYIPGPSLRQAVLDGEPFPPERVRALAAQLSEGLTAIHACGLVHRDLKPGNVIMAADGARIIDFGVARMDDASVLTETGAVVGTYAFMSPEQVQSGEIGPSSDIFALGGVLAFAATGRSPFAAATLPAIVLRIVSVEPDLGEVPGDLRGLIAACLAKDPAARPSAADLLRGLSGAGGAIRVPAPARPSPDTVSADAAPTGDPAPPRPVARRRLLVGAAGLGATLAVGGPAALLAARFGGAEAGANTDPDPAPPPPILDRTLTGHGAVVTSVAFSPDGALLASGGADGPVLLWDVATGKRVRTLEGHSYPLVGMAFSADGRTLVTGAESVRIWDVAAGRAPRTIGIAQRTGHPTPVMAMAVSPDGRHFATDGADGHALLWDVGTGKRVRTFADDADMALAFTPDGRALAGGGRELVLWDTASGSAVRRFTGLTGRVHSVAISSDGRVLAAGGEDMPVRLWDLRASGTAPFRELTGMGNSSASIAFGPGGSLLASTKPEGFGAQEITLWDVETGEVDREMNRHTDAVNTLDFHPGGAALASAGEDRTVRLWNLA